MALRACRAAFVPRHDTARKNPLRVVPGPPSRHDSTARPDTKRSSGLLVPGRIGPGQIVLGPCGPFGILYVKVFYFMTNLNKRGRLGRRGILIFSHLILSILVYING
jgi:hypothetical protein